MPLRLRKRRQGVSGAPICLRCSASLSGGPPPPFVFGASTPSPTPLPGATALDGMVASQQKPRGGWSADIVLKLTVDPASVVSQGQKVQYRGVNYTVQKITSSGLVLLKR